MTFMVESICGFVLDWILDTMRVCTYCARSVHVWYMYGFVLECGSISKLCFVYVNKLIGLLGVVLI